VNLLVSFRCAEITGNISSSSSSSSCSWRVRRVSCSLILKMQLVPPSLPRSSYVPSSFVLYCSACFGSLFVSNLCTCCSHFFWYCFISFSMFCSPVFCLIHWFFSLTRKSYSRINAEWVKRLDCCVCICVCVRACVCVCDSTVPQGCYPYSLWRNSNIRKAVNRSQRFFHYASLLGHWKLFWRPEIRKGHMSIKWTVVAQMLLLLDMQVINEWIFRNTVHSLLNILCKPSILPLDCQLYNYTT
jgi:hypothetical protein